MASGKRRVWASTPDDLAGRDRRGDRRRSVPSANKKRDLDRCSTQRHDRDEDWRHARARREVRALLAVVCHASDAVREQLIDRVQQVRAKPIGSEFKYRSRYEQSITWLSRRLVQTCRERIADTLASRAYFVGTQHLLALSNGGVWCRRDGVSTRTGLYRSHLAAFLRDCMTTRGAWGLALARRLLALLDDEIGRFSVGPSNRWSGPARWDPTLLRALLREMPGLERDLRSWAAALEGDPRATAVVKTVDG